jgi:hypothetical protein
MGRLRHAAGMPRREATQARAHFLSICDSGMSLVSHNLPARSLTVPPHFNPNDCRASFKRSAPAWMTDADGRQEKARRQSAALVLPVCAAATHAPRISSSSALLKASRSSPEDEGALAAAGAPRSSQPSTCPASQRGVKSSSTCGATQVLNELSSRRPSNH